MRRLRLLIVDDNPIERVILSRAAAALGQFDIVQAADGQAALSLCHSMLPDIVLTDYEMPVMDGPTFISHLRKIESAQNAVVALITSLSAPETIVFGLDSGADEYLFKPLRVREVQARLKALSRLAVLQLGLNNALLEVQALQSFRIAEQRSRLASFLSSGLSHELNTPLQGLVSNITFVREAVPGADPEIAGALDDCLQLVERMNLTTKRLTDFQKIKESAQPRQVKLRDVFEDALRFLPNLDCTIVCPREASAMLDPLLLRLALCAIMTALHERGGSQLTMEAASVGLQLSASFASRPDAKAMNALLEGAFDERHLARTKAEFGLIMAHDTLRQNHASLQFQHLDGSRFGAVITLSHTYHISTARSA